VEQPATPIAGDRKSEFFKMTSQELRQEAAARGKRAIVAQAELDRRQHNRALRKAARG
jgi:hypothetical protein